MSVFNPGFGAPNASLGGGSTDLTAVSSAGSVLVLSSSGIDAVIPGATATNAGVLSAADKSRLDSLSGQLSLPDFATFADAAASTPTGDFVRTAGYFSTGDGGSALYIRVASDPGHSGALQVADGSFFDLAVQRITPQMFGARGDGLADDAGPLQDFFDYMENRPDLIGDFTGNWRTSQTLTIRGNLNSRYTCGRLIGTAEMEDLLVIEGQNKNFDGTLRLSGVSAGSQFQFSNRRIQNGLRLNGAGFSKFDKIVCEGFRRYGVRLEDQGNNHINLGDVFGVDCGSVGPASPGASLTLTFTARNDNGQFGFDQRSTLTVTDLPSFIRVSDIVEVGGRPLLITNINGNQMEVYPNPPSGATSGTIECFQGGVVSTLGNDSGLSWVESITSIRVGTALRVGALYGLTVGKFHCDFAGVGIQVGFSPLSSGRRIAIEGAYFESSRHHIVHTGSFAASVVIETPNDLQFSRVTRLSFFNGADEPAQPELLGTTIVADKIYTPSIQRAFATSPSIVGLSNRAGENRFVTSQATSQIVLDYDEDIDRLYGMTTAELFLFGTGANSQLNRTLTIQPNADERDRGVTVNGQSFINLPAGENPIYVFLQYRRSSTDWVLASTEIGMPTPGNPISNPSGGGTVDSQARSAINAILATLRSQRLLNS